MFNLEQYQIIESIGHGCFGKVFKIKEISTKQVYAAKVIDKSFKNDNDDDNEPTTEETHFLFREVKLLSSINHPSVIKFIGYSQTNFSGQPNPTIITEYAPNDSLDTIIKMESSGNSPEGWDFTKKLINIYGIAAGLMFLHQHDIVHRDLKPANILLDKCLCPKIADFGMSKFTKNLTDSMLYQSQAGLKGTPSYMAPESLDQFEYSQSSDVYSFAMIVYELLTLKPPFQKETFQSILNKIMSGFRPEIDSIVPDAYRSLIERCWSQSPEDRPTFEKIVQELKTDNSFITDIVNEDDFLDYVDYIDDSLSSFNFNQSISFDEFINQKSKKGSITRKRSSTIKPVSIYAVKDDIKAKKKRSYTIFGKKSDKCEEAPNKNDDDNDAQKDKKDKHHFSFKKKSDRKDTIKNDTKDLTKIENKKEENANTENTQNLIIQDDSSDSIFVEGKEYIEGINYEQNIEKGVKILEKSISKGNIDSMLYYCKILIKGDIIPRNLDKAEKYLKKFKGKKDPRVFFLFGKLLIKKGEFLEAKDILLKGVNMEDPKCMYQYGKMIFRGQGFTKNNQEAIKYLILSKRKGFSKSNSFLILFQKLKLFNEVFNNMTGEEQVFFITHYIHHATKEEIDSRYEKSIICKKFKLQMKEIQKLDPEKISDNLITFFKSYETFTYEIDQTSKTHKINEFTFYNCRFLTSIIIPFSVTSIENNTFEGCINLKEIIFPSTIISIGSDSFKDCKSLAKCSIKFAEKVIECDTSEYQSSKNDEKDQTNRMSIGSSSFKNCISLMHFEIPPLITSIENNAFERCISLEEITIQSGITSIGCSSFAGCTSLKKIILPPTLSEIGKFSFYENKSLIEIILSPNLTLISMNCFYGCTSLKKVEIPNSIKTIEESAFEGCTSLTNISSLDQITSIDDKAFYECKFLPQSIKFDSLSSIGDKSFYGCTSFDNISLPSIETIGKNAFEGCASLKTISFSLYLKSILDGAFSDCTSLKEIYISSPIDSVEENTFSGCKSLRIVDLPYSVDSIGDNSFYECCSLHTIDLSSIKKLGEYSFYKCALINQAKLHSITSIGQNAFDGCTNLTEVILSNSLESIHDNAFSYCTCLQKIIIPSKINSVPNGAFEGCTSLKEIIFKGYIISVGYNAFYDCSSLKEISLPLVKTIGKNAFYGCSNLKKMIVPSSDVSIGESALPSQVKLIKQ